MSQILETMMIICFGLSWPISVYKSFKARTTNGKSLVFLLAIWIGYICGIGGKLLAGNINYVLIIYFFNLLVVSCDLILYFRNHALDLQRAKQAKAKEAIA
ncbi:MAG: hypothetical protein HFE64_10945 [Lachnospiraceae bacterium]|jgi:hypothetical protein|nr:hypothetical protein [Lachnospiraceae bacterium]